MQYNSERNEILQNDQTEIAAEPFCLLDINKEGKRLPKIDIQ